MTDTERTNKDEGSLSSKDPIQQGSLSLPELAGFQRKYLRGLAHSLKPLVQVGNGGVTEGVVKAMDQALLDHELIKVRMHEPEDKKGMAVELAQRSKAHLCGLVGHSAILYRPHPKEPQIVVPQRKAAD
jgi:RNA-binding protein